MVRKTVLLFGLLLALAISNVTVSQADQRQLGQVVYITLSKACSCTLVLCQAGDIIVGNVFSGERKGLLKRIDYSTDKEAARVYLKQYGITQAPALLVSGHAGQTAVDGLGGTIGKGYSGETAGVRQLKQGAGRPPPNR